jgi:hypothetical protein
MRASSSGALTLNELDRVELDRDRGQLGERVAEGELTCGEPALQHSERRARVGAGQRPGLGNGGLVTCLAQRPDEFRGGERNVDREEDARSRRGSRRRAAAAARRRPTRSPCPSRCAPDVLAQAEELTRRIEEPGGMKAL